MASSSSSFERTLAVQLRLVGKGLLNAPSSVDELLVLLDEAEDLLANMEQGPSEPLEDSLLPVMKALIADSLLKHSIAGVRVSVAYCLSELMRISAPQEPFNDDQMKLIFELIVESFSKLSQASTKYYEKALSILETVARVKACLLMLDLKCDALVVQMFQNFWAIIRSNPADDVVSAVEQIMMDILGESEDISLGLLSPLLASVLKENKNVAPSCWKLGERVIARCAAKLGPVLHGAGQSNGTTVDDYSPVVASICENEPKTMEHNHANDSSQPVESGLPGKRLVGQKIKIWWPFDEMFYSGVVQSYDPFRKRHKVLYDDGDIETLNLEKERWELIKDDLPTKGCN